LAGEVREGKSKHDLNMYRETRYGIDNANEAIESIRKRQ